MAEMRSEGQVLIGCWCDAAFVAAIDSFNQTNSRSQFCRDAMREYLRRNRIHVPPEKTKAPNRAGKGGKQGYTRYPKGQKDSVMLNEALVSSKGADVRSNLLSIGIVAGPSGHLKHPPSPGVDAPNAPTSQPGRGKKDKITLQPALQDKALEEPKPEPK